MVSIFVRIWLVFTLVLVLGGLVFFTSLERHVRPTAQHVVEDTLIDTSRLLASFAAEPLYRYQKDLAESILNNERKDHLGALTAGLDAAFAQNNQIAVWHDHKRRLDFHIYLTDKSGKVVYDSAGSAVGSDFSKWNDVYLTLKGEYGARTTRHNPYDEDSAVMYVAAPVVYNGHTIGVVSVGKPSKALLPYLERTYASMVENALWIGVFALAMAALVALWLRRSIAWVDSFAQSLGADAKKPYFFLGSELNSLTKSIESMRDALENKAYVETYVHTLTHELKSPITAIHASSELLSDDLPAADRERFSRNIQAQCSKMESLVERLLLLAKLEQPKFRLQKTKLNVSNLLLEIIELNTSKTNQSNINIQLNVANNVMVYADKFWLSQALNNVLDNAIRFCDGEIGVSLERGFANSSQTKNSQAEIVITNTGKPIPDYALHKVFERYFSLPKDAKASKGTGLGLTLVKEVIEKHGGQVMVENIQLSNREGVRVSVII